MTDQTPGRTDEQSPADMPKAVGPTSARLRWAWAFIAFFLVLAAWSVAAPYSGTPDEQDHILRAYGVATGQVLLDPAPAQRGAGAFVDAPQGLVVDQCWQFDASVSAACTVEPGGDTDSVSAPTGAGRYFPLYYGLVGGPLALWPSWLGVLLARLLSAGLCAALLANALTDAMRWSRHRLMAVGVIVAATPMVAHMGGAINPSGLELAAGIAFFAAAIPLLYAPAAARNTTLLWHTGIAALGLATLRMAGPLFLLLAVVGLLFLVRRAHLLQLWKWRALRWWTVGVGGAALIAIGYTIVFKSADLGSHFVSNRWATTQLLWIETQRWHQYLDEMIGVTSWLDTRMPEIVYVLWEAAAATAIVVGFLVARRDGRSRMALLFLAGTLVPLVTAVRYANEVGFITQGRYLLPLLVGLPLLGVYLIQEHGVSERISKSATRAVVGFLLPLHLVVLGYTMVRWQNGLAYPPGVRALNPFVGSWHPPLGTVTPIVASVVGLVGLGWLVWTGGRLPSFLARAGGGGEPVVATPSQKQPADQTAESEVSGRLRAWAGKGLE